MGNEAKTNKLKRYPDKKNGIKVGDFTSQKAF